MQATIDHSDDASGAGAPTAGASAAGVPIAGTSVEGAPTVAAPTAAASTPITPDAAAPAADAPTDASVAGAPTDADPLAGAPTAGDLSAQLRPAILRVSRRLRAEKADNELSDSQSAILGYLLHNGPSTPGTLAGFERVTPPSMNRTINAVVEAGYAVRTPSADDGRKVVISLTDEGAALVRETRRRRNVWLYRRLAELAPDDRLTLERAATILRELADS